MMESSERWHLVKKVAHWLLAVVIALYLITGFGITEYRVVESLTFGLLTKSLSFKIHNNLWIPLLALLIFHICQRTCGKAYRAQHNLD